MIKLQIVGNLGKDCIVKEVNGKNVINFSVAHTERFKDSQGNQKERTTWVECAYWTDRTAVAQYLTKGKTVYAEGAPEAEAYMNKDNQAAATLRMRVQSVQLLGGSGGDAPAQRPASSSSSVTSSPSSGSIASDSPVADDLPF
ncbi:single-stranded DNA-binding protein [Ferruginibacter lapsinanis]|uniref:single-stranded DNA-binding protein n=1 Tax=Ferruginibacter lapsinanis TaxID=563172 RepID=UPI001E3439AD|nr:single-stranded DNA-binding protein [Ferruginibacter lapsinanis]UEG48537.1 single-stranded DNA-binding protein [Ferruginibacter lapsinanis]